MTHPAASFRVRPLDPTSNDEVRLVARRMRATLSEVLGPERGESMYTMDWLEDRVRQHLDPARLTGQVFVAETAGAGPPIVGHVIVRADRDARGDRIGLFSTIYIAPEHRGRGVARALIETGERWMVENRLSRAVTYTDENNHKLHELFSSSGYELSPMPDQFVALSRRIGDVTADSNGAD